MCASLLIITWCRRRSGCRRRWPWRRGSPRWWREGWSWRTRRRRRSWWPSTVSTPWTTGRWSSERPEEKSLWPFGLEGSPVTSHLPWRACTRRWCSRSRTTWEKRRSSSWPARACSSRGPIQRRWWSSSCRWWGRAACSRRRCCRRGCTTWRASPCWGSRYRRQSCYLPVHSCNNGSNHYTITSFVDLCYY